jgi:hypothetical protein
MVDISKIEYEIDEDFAQNPLTQIPWTQSAWTMLSVIEDHHFKITVKDDLSEEQASIYVDGLMNAVTYPFRVLLSRSPKNNTHLDRRFINEHYELAAEWIDKAEGYTHFCSIFPLFHGNEIDLNVKGNFLEPSDWSSSDLSYETYDRFVAKRNPAQQPAREADVIAKIIYSHIKINGGNFSVAFNQKILNLLEKHSGAAFRWRHSLPNHWMFSNFSILEFREVFMTLQLMAEAMFVARQIVAPTVVGVAYEGSVWAPKKGSLVKLINTHTKISPKTIQIILEYLTFGAVGIRNPDVAIQPLIDLGNAHYAISPFLILHTNAERNLCVLLNQIKCEQKLYSHLVNEKESLLRDESISSLKDHKYEFKYGEIENTDIDLAIIDRQNKVCLCIEVKWLIEPAEIREVRERSVDIQKGINQAKLISNLYEQKNKRLLSLLEIESTYDFLAIVGSENFTGRANIQDLSVPVIKLWHLIAKINEDKSLAKTLTWLRNKEYLPVKDRDFRVEEIDLSAGKWKSKWYGISYI